MALYRDVIFKRGPNLLELIAQEKNKVNLKCAKKLTIRFDPFRKDVGEIRKFAFHINAEEISIKSPKCLIQTEILTDRSEQNVTINLLDGKNFIIKCAHLKCLELFKLINEHITPLSPVEESVTALSVSQLKKGKVKTK